jgi:N-sulfoglucosamine sulfohydrolase
MNVPSTIRLHIGNLESPPTAHKAPSDMKHLPWILAFIGCCCFASIITAETPPAALPNIVVFISDDHGMLDSEPYGATDIRTPNLKLLAADGVKFTHAFAASPSCGPSRSALLTGLWPARNGAEPNHKPKRPEVPGLPKALKALGYEVAAIGKVAHNDFAKYYDFDFIAGPNLGAVSAKSVAEFLNHRDHSKPLCLFFGTHYPHTPWIDNNGYDPARLMLPPTFVDTRVTREQRARYYSSVTAADALLGEVRELTRKHLSGDTLFIYTADQGAAWPFGKWDLYDASTRVPMIIVWPGHLKPATTQSAMVCLPDLLPTFLELAGGKVPDGLDGKSFAAVLRGEADAHRDRVFATCSGDGNFNVYPSRSVRTRDWKYILNLHPEFQHHTHISRSPGLANGILYWETWLAAAEKSAPDAAVVKRYTVRPSEELYDLKSDPFEMHNLATEPENAQRLSALRTEVKAWMQSQGDKQTVFGKPLLVGEPVTIIGRPAKP